MIRLDDEIVCVSSFVFGFTSAISLMMETDNLNCDFLSTTHSTSSDESM